MNESLYTVLIAELRVDPLGRGYSNATPREAADSLNVEDRTVADSERKTTRELLERYGMTQASVIFDKLAAAADANSGIALALEAIQDYAENGGLDFSNPATILEIEALVDNSALTPDEATLLKNLGEKTVSRAKELGLPRMTEGIIHSARIKMES